FVRKSPMTREPRAAQSVPKSIGVILSQIGDELNLNILLGVEQAAKPRGYQLNFAYAQENAQELALDIARLKSSTAGLVIFPISDTIQDDAIASLHSEQYPLVLVD